jgi:AraC-like DNA-binding protein
VRRLTSWKAVSRQRHGPGAHIPAHRHLEPYATLVLDGGYCEAGESGRWNVEAGMLIVHARGESHADWFGSRPSRLIDFHLPADVAPGVFWAGALDAALGSIDCDEAAIAGALSSLEPVAAEADWPDLLAADIRKDCRLSLTDWAARFGIRRETVSRGFLKAYGVSPAAYRAGVRVKSALGALHHDCGRLADVAVDHGFADQAHMSRAIRSATGRTPGQLREVKSVQDWSATAV